MIEQLLEMLKEINATGELQEEIAVFMSKQHDAFKKHGFADSIATDMVVAICGKKS